jgi:divalent metal cation (Fe/Co/Zn/Cd) transporter
MRHLHRDRRAIQQNDLVAPVELTSLYVFVQSIYVFALAHRARLSLLGASWLVVTVVVMLLLARGKLVTRKKLGSTVLMTEARVTLVDAYLAGAVLVGVTLNGWLGWG